MAITVGGTCGTHHGSTAIVLDVTSLAYTWWLSSRSPLARTPQTQAQLLFAADCSQLGSLVLPALAALPRQTSHPSLAGPFPIRKSTSDMFNTSIKRQIRPTEEKNSAAASYGAMGNPDLTAGPQQQASELSDFVLI